MASLLPYVLLLLCFFSTLSTLPVFASDPDPLQDFCVADNTSTVFINGVVCKPAAQVVGGDFSSMQLRNPASFTNLGSAVNLASVGNFAGLNTLGLSLARIDFKPNGLNPPHVHPRATELLYLAEGQLDVGFISTTNNTLFKWTIYKGDLFVFPRGLIHFQLNTDKYQSALAIAALNSQNPGASQVAGALFKANPPLPPEVLEIAFGIDSQEVYNLEASVKKTLAPLGT